ncbi:uncharacterized protein TEOVI_000101500 [Trypanosoma equiperdum]|uniref:Uncharacterized protein n=3 Tax=Trypanozoon TaxID=39700 RepID=Q38E67_TRYB2|nr:hypothetical protein, conserved [Trypanosoma brucei brucei TREU927]EAN76903.1 hypothetical protein, conserved [Trypanosoma brucei brucei TREU927]RHW70207.1 hypothetical protein DPX39_090050500 [Trypanosoma brucei equiperdum]SCU69449.1 hypothetical protein, conserved [Trypanosoma equiperdum]
MQELAVFKRPHLHACSEYVDVAVELAPLRRCESFTDFLQLLQGELEFIYGSAPKSFNNAILYSTHEAPCSFSCYFSEKQLEMLRNFDEACEKESQMRVSYENVVAEYDAKVEENKDRKMNRRRRMEMEKARKRVKVMDRDVKQAEYEVKKSAQKLANIFQIAALRVLLN